MATATATATALTGIRDSAEETPQVTLLELVQVVSECADNEHEVVATVRHMLLSGSVKLRGNFRDAPPRDFC